MEFVQLIGSLLFVVSIISLLMHQYIMIIKDLISGDYTTFELIIGLIPLAPYIVMLVVGLIYSIKLILRN